MGEQNEQEWDIIADARPSRTAGPVTDLAVAEARMAAKKRYGEDISAEPSVLAAHIALDALIVAAHSIGTMSTRELIKLAETAANIADKLRRTALAEPTSDAASQVVEAIKNALKEAGVTAIQTRPKAVSDGSRRAHKRSAAES